MVFQRTVKGGTHPLHRFLSRQSTVGFRDASLAMGPLGFNRIEPGAFDGQGANQQAHALTGTLDELVMLPNPLAHRFADMPGSVIPDDDQHGLAQCLGFRTAPFQELKGAGTEGTILNKAQPHLFRLVILLETRQQAVAGQRLAVRVAGLFALFHQAQRLVALGPGRQMWLLKATPPGLILESHDPIGVLLRQPDQSVAGVFCAHTPGQGW